MPTSPAGSSRRPGTRGFTLVNRSAEDGFGLVDRSAEHGFTLVELMVVLTVIGLASAAVVFTMPDPRGRLTDEAARFALRTRAAHDAAIVNGRPVSVWVTTGGYGFDQRIGGSWLPIADKPLRVERWSEGTRASVVDRSGRERVTFDSTGLADKPIDIRLVRRDAKAVVEIDADGTVRVGA